VSSPEYSQWIDIRQITDAPLVLEPDADARRRLAGRFSIPAIPAMRAEVHLLREGTRVTATGRLIADIIQACRVSAEEFPLHIDERVLLRFVPSGSELSGEPVPDAEIELSADDLDEIVYEGQAFDLGEAIAQTLALAIDPFAEGPDADAFRAEHELGEASASGPFAALAALRKQD
jgi:uncharacterized metal-binding protein YceD (DUF177 family)